MAFVGHGRIYDMANGENGRTYVASALAGWEMDPSFLFGPSVTVYTGNSITSVDYESGRVAWGDDAGNVLIEKVIGINETPPVEQIDPTRLEGHQYRITALQFNGERLLASGDSSGVTRLWEISEDEQGMLVAVEAVVIPNTRAVHGFTFSPYNLVFIEYGGYTADTDVFQYKHPYIGAIPLVDPPRYETQPGFERHAFYSSVSNMRFDSLDQLSADVNGVRLAWRLHDEEAIEPFESLVDDNEDDETISVVSADGLRRAEADDSVIRLYDTATDTLITTYYGHFRAVTDLTFSPDGSLLFSASLDRTLKVWDATATGEQSALIRLEAQTVGGAELLMREDGRLLVSAGDDGLIRFWGTAPRPRYCL